MPPLEPDRRGRREGQDERDEASYARALAAHYLTHPHSQTGQSLTRCPEPECRGWAEWFRRTIAEGARA